MKVVNEVLEADEKHVEEETGNGFELKKKCSSDFQILTTENESNIASKDNKIVEFFLKIRSFFLQLFFSKSFASSLLRTVIINGVFISILVASIVEYVKKGYTDIDWCNGVGCLWIIYILVYLGLFYFLIKKLYVKFCLRWWPQTLKMNLTFLANKYFRTSCYLLPILLLGGYVVIYPGKTGRRIFSFVGLIVFIIFGFLFSRHPQHIKWRTVISGIILQFIFGFIIIRVKEGQNILECIGNKITRFLLYAEDGANFVYGYLAKSENEKPIFAFSVLPVIFFLCFCVNILTYYGVLQWLIAKVGSFVEMVMGTTACESLNAVASIFLGMTEAPLLIQSYLKDLTRSEICAILCAGWATIAGSVLGAYIKFGVNASHLIAASIMSAPASLSFSKLFYPESEKSTNRVKDLVLVKQQAYNVLDAATKGAMAATSIVLGITANIIAITAFISFVDGILSWLGLLIGFKELSFKFLSSKILFPVSFLIGVDTGSLEDVAHLIGIKVVANEFQAYQMLGELIKENKLTERAEILATYVLCGFSNFGSIGISVGALSSMEASQSGIIAEVSLRAFVASNIVCFMTACVAGCLID